MSTPTAAHGALPEAGELLAAIRGYGKSCHSDGHYGLTESAATTIMFERVEASARAALSPASPAPADALALAILNGKTYAELREKTVYLMALNANQARTIDALQLAATPAQQTQSDAVAGAEKALDEALAQRDDYHEWADQLAEQIAAITGAEIGEHSSSNNPWHEAMLAADEHIASDLRKMLGGEAPYVATPPQQATPTMQDALAAGDGTLHGAIDQCQLDALRYRWLRAGNYPIALAKQILNDTPHNIDAVIDAALKEAPGGWQ